MNESIVVTGGSKGIGRAIVLKLAGQGFHVISGSRSPITNVPSELKDFILHCEIDVKNPTDHEKIVDIANSKNMQLRAFVNNAGFSEWQPIENIDPFFLQNILETNLMGYFWGVEGCCTRPESWWINYKYFKSCCAARNSQQQRVRRFKIWSGWPYPKHG